MSQLSEFYSKAILEHFKHPHNLGKLEDADIIEKGFNVSCGDDIHLFVRLKDHIIEQVSHVGRRSAISQSSTSMMTEVLTGKRIEEALALVEEFDKMITGQEPFQEDGDLAEFSALKGVVKMPSRVPCAMLPWGTLKIGIERFQQAGKKT